MRTEMLSPATDQAWLEFFPPHQSTPEICPVDRAPFTIGRNETCGLPVNSSRVSREHAVIESLGADFRIRDLGSTNGTFVNGERVQEAPLREGDVLLIADVEYSFRQKREGGAGRATATQVIDSPTSDTGSASDADLVMAVRSVQERLLRGALDVRFTPLVSLENGHAHGYQAFREESGSLALSRAERSALAVDCRLAARFRQLERHVAVEKALELPGAERLLIELAAAEIGAPETEDSLGRLRLLAGEKLQLIVEAADSAVCDIPYVRDFLRMLRELGVQVAYGEFTGGQVRAAAHRDIAPDYLKLSPGLVRDVDRHTGRRRQIEEIVRAARDIKCEVIAAGIARAEEAQVCREAGCRFAQGDYFTSATRSGAFQSSKDSRSNSHRRM